MGADNHPTTRVQTNDRAVLANRLAADLRDTDGVEVVGANEHTDGLVKFQVERSNMPAHVMGVLADHDANLSAICLETDASFQTAHAHAPRS